MNIRLEYLTLDQLLAKRLFRIPHYQRAYSWTDKECSDMFKDISKLKDKPEAGRYQRTGLLIAVEVAQTIQEKKRMGNSTN